MMPVLTMQARPPRRGAILITAMIVVFALAGMVIALCRSMRVETMVSANLAASVQASAIERAAEQYVLAMLADTSIDVRTLTEDYFAAVPVGDGYFWILRPDYDDTTLPAFGLVEESSKLNINSATLEQLLYLPTMTEDVAAAIIDWRDEDSNVSNFGAETEYYQSLATPYTCKNAPFETVEELLLVRDVTRELLYGNGLAAPLGDVSGMGTSGMGASGSMLFDDTAIVNGLYDLLTIHSVEPNTAADGTQRINITDNNQRNALTQLLQQQLGSTRGSEVMNAVGPAAIRDVFDLHFRGKLTPDELDLIADYVTSSTGEEVRGRINVNSAPYEVLACLGTLEPADVDKLVSARRTAATSDPSAISWVAEALGEKAVGLGGRITGQSHQYSADILATSGNGRAFKRCRIVVDISGGTPIIVYRRDLTQRGWPMDEQILTSLRAGEGPGGWGSMSGGIFR